MISDNALTTVTQAQGQNSTALATPYTDDENPAYAYLASLGSNRSRRVMADDLSIIAALLQGVEPSPDIDDHAQRRQWTKERRGMVFTYPWDTLEVSQVNTIRALLAERYKYRTANRMLSALRGVIRYCWKLEKITEEKRARLSDFDAVKGSSVPAGRDLSYTERAKLFETCAEDATPAGARDAALLACADAGLRRAEIARLDLEDVNLVEGWLFVHGKGNKERTVHVNDGGMLAIKDWLSVRGAEPGPLLWPVNKGGNVTNRRMSSQSVYNVMRKRGAEAGIEKFTPHDFRRTYAGDQMDNGTDISTVAAQMGHSSVDITANYDRRKDRAKKKAAAARHTPYKGRKQQALNADA